MFIKKKLLWILLFGSLIGLNETLIGSLNVPYRSVILSSITLAILSVARSQIPKTGTSLLIIVIAILYKINSIGVHSCTTNVLLCGPTALLILGIGYEVSASLIIAKNTFKYLYYVLACGFTSIVAFSIFAVMNTYILSAWDTSRLSEYIFVKASLTAIASSVLSILALYTVSFLKNVNVARLNPYVIQGLLGSIIIALWLFGYFTT
ncbi:MAG: hypothetical protein WC868_00980 [Bacteroidales bacterium]